MSSHVTSSIKKGKRKTRHAYERQRVARQVSTVERKEEEISSERNSYSCQRTRGGLTNVTDKIARKERSVFVLSTSTSRPNRFTTRVRVPEPPSIHHPRVSCESHDVPSRSSSIPSQKNRQKLPFASMLLLCQHSHYVSANSKPLLYLFRVYDILYFTFFNYFFCSLILDVPCLYHQPTAKLPISSLPPLFLSHPDLVSFNPLVRASSPRRVLPTRLSPLTFSLSLSFFLAVYK